MDRQIVYPGSIPLDTDLLNIQRNVMTVVGALAEMIVGEFGLADGLACVPGANPYTVSVGRGSFATMLRVDDRPFGSLPVDSSPLVQIAYQPADTVLQLGPPPGADQVICWLVQAAVTELDTVPVALSYWNAADPAVPFSGPGNSGGAQNTQRQMRVLLSCKASGPEAFPVGSPPTADVGWVGLYAVTTFAGKAGIEAGDIVPVVNAPFLRFKLPALPPGYSMQATFTDNTLWRAPAGVRWARVRLVGGGGGGGGGSDTFSGGGGGAGGYAEAVLPIASMGEYTITVGAGGGAAVTGGSGGSGGMSDFNGLVQAIGGQGGGSANPDSHGGEPGRGTIGGVALAGGYGGDGATVASVPGGNGGASAFGGGGRGADGGGVPAMGLAPGSGGGGGYGTFAAGGSGARGLVIIEY